MLASLVAVHVGRSRSDTLDLMSGIGDLLCAMPAVAFVAAVVVLARRS